jgi:hypothetical protein
MTTDVLAYSDKRHWAALKIAAKFTSTRLRDTKYPVASEWERNHLADTIDNLADYAAVLRSQLVTIMLERRQSANEGAR